MQKEFTIAKEAALEAGKKIMEFYDSGAFTVEDKVEGDRVSPLTQADLAANKIIVEKLRANFDYPILTEEEKDQPERLQHGVIWIVDPIDGTKEFIKHLDEFTVNIALVHQGVPVIGVIYAPATGEFYFAVKGQGAWLYNEHEKRINVSDKTNPREMTMVQSRSHASDALAEIIQRVGFAGTVVSGSSIKGCLVAKGAADTYLRLGPQNEWDICAMNCIVTEAGGKMTTLKGKPLIFNRQDTLIEGGFLVSNGNIHDKLLELING